jgi:hypothetical protein
MTGMAKNRRKQQGAKESIGGAEDNDFYRMNAEVIAGASEQPGRRRPCFDSHDHDR